jgi:hypothetical protein
MAYIFELDTELPDVFVDNQGTSVVEFALGYDLEAEEIVLFSVTLGPSVDGASDLRFGIRKRHAEKEWKVSGLDFSREGVSGCIPAHARVEVRLLMLEAVNRLAEQCADDKITMETYYQNLPIEALRKYELISNQLNFKGFYTETTFRDEDGTDYWLFVRSGLST